jgi:5-formyltetrahydrofolate cyclo-ligase
MSKTQKESLRKACLKIRKSLPESFCKKASSTICSTILSCDWFARAKNIALYSAFNQEVDLKQLLIPSDMGAKSFYLPKVLDENTLAFVPIDENTKYIKNKYAILEPDVAFSKQIRVSDLDIIFLPLVAFDAEKHRIGMGRGYYDRALANHQEALLIGVAYSFQQQEFILNDEWDVNLDIIITEDKIF